MGILQDNSLQRALDRPAITVALVAVLAGCYLLLYPVTQPDHFKFLLPWLRAIIGSDGMTVFATDFSNYTGGYITFLALMSLLSPLLSELAIIKLTAIIGTALAAFGVMACLRAVGWRGRAVLNAGLCFALLPTVMINGIGWGQADAFYGAFVLFSMAAVLRDRPLAAGLLFAVAISIKLQAILFAPFLIGYLLKSPRQLGLAFLLLVPVYLAVNSLYLAAGRPISDVLLIYAGQAQTFVRLSMNAGNLWLLADAFLPSGVLESQHRNFVLTGVGMAFSVGLFILWRVWRGAVTAERLLYFACLSALLMPFLLPKMHERFFSAPRPCYLSPLSSTAATCRWRCWLNCQGWQCIPSTTTRWASARSLVGRRRRLSAWR